jgi:hypothetical protein
VHCNVYHAKLLFSDSVEEFARRVLGRTGRLDLLVNNAGLLMPLYTPTKQGFEVRKISKISYRIISYTVDKDSARISCSLQCKYMYLNFLTAST